LQRKVNLPLRGNYQVKFDSPSDNFDWYLYQTTSVSDSQGNVVASVQRDVGASLEIGETLNFSVTNAGLCALSFGNLVNYAGTSNAVLLDNISIVKTDFGPLANGGFDATTLLPGQYQYLSVQSQPVDSWAYAGNAGIATDSANKANFATGYPGVYAGTNYAFLQTATGTPGAMEQSVALPIAGRWLMTFSFAGRLAGTGFGGNASFSANVIDSGGNTLVTTQLVASSGELFTNQALAFTAYNNGPFTLRFDNVQNTSGNDNRKFVITMHPANSMHC
jgi:hypothetical protein